MVLFYVCLLLLGCGDIELEVKDITILNHILLTLIVVVVVVVVVVVRITWY